MDGCADRQDIMRFVQLRPYFVYTSTTRCPSGETQNEFPANNFKKRLDAGCYTRGVLVVDALPAMWTRSSYFVYHVLCSQRNGLQ
jgi:hypothetical protein